MEKDFCKKCGDCCKQIFVDFDKKILYFDGIQTLDEDFAQMLVPIGKKESLSICYCKYLKNNKCTNSQKPTICVNYPSSPFAYIPSSCGFYGDIFLKLEAEKQKIRKLKEEIIHYQALTETTVNKREQQQYDRILRTLKTRVDKYSIYGSKDW